MGLIKKLRKAKKEAPPNEKPAVVKTHLRDMIIVPEMIGSVVGIYNGKVNFAFTWCRWCDAMQVRRLQLRRIHDGRRMLSPLPDYSYSLFRQVFNSVEIKPEMTGHYLGEFSCSYRPVKHGRPGVSSPVSSFLPCLQTLFLQIGATHCMRFHVFNCDSLFTLSCYHLQHLDCTCFLSFSFWTMIQVVSQHSSQIAAYCLHIFSLSSCT